MNEGLLFVETTTPVPERKGLNLLLLCVFLNFFKPLKEDEGKTDKTPVLMSVSMETSWNGAWWLITQGPSLFSFHSNSTDLCLCRFHPHQYSEKVSMS